MAETVSSKTDLWKSQFEFNEKLNSNLDEIQEMMNLMMDMIRGLNKSSISQTFQSPSSIPEAAHNLFDQMTSPAMTSSDKSKVDLKSNEKLQTSQHRDFGAAITREKSSDELIDVNKFLEPEEATTITQVNVSEKEAYKVLDELIKPVATGLHSFLSSSKAEACLIVKAANQLVAEVGEVVHLHSLTPESLKDNPHLFDEITKPSSEEPNEEMYVIQEYISPFGYAPQIFDPGSSSLVDDGIIFSFDPGGSSLFILLLPIDFYQIEGLLTKKKKAITQKVRWHMEMKVSPGRSINLMHPALEKRKNASVLFDNDLVFYFDPGGSSWFQKGSDSLRLKLHPLHFDTPIGYIPGSTHGICILQLFEALAPQLLAIIKINTWEGRKWIEWWFHDLFSFSNLYNMDMNVYEMFMKCARLNNLTRSQEHFLLLIDTCASGLVMDSELNASHTKLADPFATIGVQSTMGIVQDNIAWRDQLHNVFKVGPLELLCIILDQATLGLANENSIAVWNSDIYVTTLVSMLGQFATNLRVFAKAGIVAAIILSLISRQADLHRNKELGSKLYIVDGQVGLESVDFSHPLKHYIQALKNATLMVPTGMRTTLVRSIGSGRSTVVAELENFIWDPGQCAVFIYILEDKDVLKRKGIRVRLALKQHAGLNGPSTYYNAHPEFLACSLIDRDFEEASNNLIKASIKGGDMHIISINVLQQNGYVQTTLFQLGYIDVRILHKEMLRTFSLLCFLERHWRSRKTLVVAGGTNLENFVWKPGPYMFCISLFSILEDKDVLKRKDLSGNKLVAILFMLLELFKCFSLINVIMTSSTT